MALDFIGPLPEEDGFKDATAQDVAVLFFDHWFCEHGLPQDIVCDRDVKFVSRFWKALHELTGVKQQDGGSGLAFPRGTFPGRMGQGIAACAFRGWFHLWR